MFFKDFLIPVVVIFGLILFLLLSSRYLRETQDKYYKKGFTEASQLEAEKLVFYCATGSVLELDGNKYHVFCIMI